MPLSQYNFATDQGDLNFLISDYSPEITRSHLDMVTNPKRIAGVQLAIQRYVNLLLGTLGSIQMDPNSGTYLVQGVQDGRASNEAALTHLFLEASSATLDFMRADQQSDLYGDIDPSEDIIDVSLIEVRVDSVTAEVMVDATVTTAAGNSVRIVIPVR